MYQKIRKMYIVQRVPELLREKNLQRRDAKERACAEFDQFVAQERENAVRKYRMEQL